MSPTLTKSRLAIGIVALALLAPATAQANHVFSDVEDDKFYAGPIEWAAANGITTGKSADTFAPDDNVTRGESVTFLQRYHDNLVAPDLTNLGAKIDGTIDAIISNSSDIEDLEDVLSAASGGAAAIAANTAAIAANTGAVNANTSDIADNTADIADNTADIADNTGDIATNTADIATNTADIATNTADIATLQGQVGALGWERVEGTNTSVDSGLVGSATASCPVGKVVVGGGHLSVPSTDEFAVLDSYPSDSGTWTVRALNAGALAGQEFRAYALCLSATP